ncbi:hypothetical protein Mic1_50 [Microcystis phage Mic1]|nr:hypothetical protein Mic1_50 [Microcystis phage Mic1]
MKYTVIKSIIRILGVNWYGQTCAMLKELKGYDVDKLENSGLGQELSKEQKREVIEVWLVKNSGDFQRILDFEADIELGDGSNVTVEWLNEDSEFEYMDAMYGLDE